MRDPKLETKRYWLLRFWRPRDNKVVYARDVAPWGAHRRKWSTTEEITRAYKFSNRGDARQVTRTKAFKELIEGPWVSGHFCYTTQTSVPGTNDMARAYFWEVIEVTETITTVFEEEISASNAPPMVRLARSID